MKNLNEQGQEIPDDTPIVLRVRGVAISQYDQIRAYVRRELSDQARGMGAETFEEANDFDVDDETIHHAPHEYTEEQEMRDLEAIEDEKARRAAKKKKASTGNPVEVPPAGAPAPAPRSKKPLRSQMFLQALDELPDEPSEQ